MSRAAVRPTAVATMIPPLRHLIQDAPSRPLGHPWLSPANAVAGLCVAGLLLPQAVAYAGLAHLPVQHALVATLCGLLIYALFGRSRFAVVSPTSSTASLAAAAAASMAGGGGGLTPADALVALTLASGVILLLLSVARQGQLSAYVSRTVLRGFAFGLSLTIVIAQLPDALGLTWPAGHASDALHVLLWVFGQRQQWHGASVCVALAAGMGILVLRRWPMLPASLLVMVAAILALRYGGLQRWSIPCVGQVPLPGWSVAWPALSQEQWLRVTELAFGLVVLIFAESWGSIRGLGLAYGDAVDANTELGVLGACNVLSALMQGMPVGAGFSASSANAASGATSKSAAALAGLVVAGAIACALPSLAYLPRAVLAVAVVSALWSALNPRPLLEVWRMGRDRSLVVAAVLCVLLLGSLHGMLAAIGLSLMAAMRRFSEPQLHELGELERSGHYVSLLVHPQACRVPGVLVVRPEEPLFFASAERVVAEVMSKVRAPRAPGAPALACVVLSLEVSGDLDSTAAECLMELDQQLQRMGVVLLLSRVKDPVRALLQQWQPSGLGAAQRLYLGDAQAVAYAATLVERAHRLAAQAALAQVQVRPT